MSSKYELILLGIMGAPNKQIIIPTTLTHSTVGTGIRRQAEAYSQIVNKLWRVQVYSATRESYEAYMDSVGKPPTAHIEGYNYFKLKAFTTADSTDVLL